MTLINRKLVSNSSLWFIVFLLLFVVPVNAQIVNGDFVGKNFSGWSITGVSPAYPPRADYGSGYAWLPNDLGGSSYLTMYQDVDVTGFNDLNFVYWGDSFFNRNGDVIYAEVGANRLYLEELNFSAQSYSINVSDLTGVQRVLFYVDSVHQWISIGSFDDIYLSTLPLENSISFNPDIDFSNSSQLYFDYTVSPDYSEYVYFVTSVWEPATYNLFDYQNSLSNVVSGENVSLSSIVSADLSNYSLRLYATPSYPAYVGDAILLAESDPIYYNSSYIVPSPPSVPDVPIIDPVDPPIFDDLNQTSELNGTINNTWFVGYYSSVDNLSSGFFDPAHSVLNYSLYPVTLFTSYIVDVNDSVTDNFIMISEYRGLYDLLVLPFINAIHPKVVVLFTFNLFCYLILLIFRG